MLVYAVGPSRGTVKLLRQNREFVDLETGGVSFYRDQDSYFLRTGNGFRCAGENVITHGGAAVLQHRTEEGKVELFYSAYSSGYDQYSRYAYGKQKITIGGSVDDDIYIRDGRINPSRFVYDVKEKVLHDQGSGVPWIINQKRTIPAHINSGDCFQILNLKIIFSGLFCAVCGCENILVSLPAFQRKEKENILCLPFIPSNSLPVSEKTAWFHIVLEEPLPAEKIQRQPLIFSIGPALTMSFAAMGSGFLTIYHGYLSGREISDSIGVILLPIMMLISTLLWSPLQRLYEQRRYRLSVLRRSREYRLYLQDLQQQIMKRKTEYIEYLFAAFPSPENMLCLQVDGKWREIRGDGIQVRLGIGNDDFSVQLDMPFSHNKEDEIVRMCEELCRSTAQMDHVPLVFSMPWGSHVYVEAEDVMFSMMFQISLQCADRFSMILICEENWIKDHPWIRTLPVFADTNGMKTIFLNRLQADNHIRKISDENAVIFDFSDGEHILSHKHLILQMTDSCKWSRDTHILKQGSKAILFHNGKEQIFEPDSLNENLFCMLSFLLFQKLGSDQKKVKNESSFYRLFGVHDAAELSIAERWRINSGRKGLRIPCGLNEENQVIELDLSERGHGPHGLIAGMTGSGKSEFLLSFLTATAVCYSPLDVRFVLIDFKGGGINQYFSNQRYRLPHIYGTLSNLETSQTERALVSLKRECVERQQLFQKLGTIAGTAVESLERYRECWRKEYNLPFLPELIVVIDEFAELKKEYPEFMRELISISRIGRSLGIHLILSTQKAYGVVDEEIWANAHFKICLKVQEKQDSIEMIRSPAASELRNAGEFFLFCDDMLEKGRGGFINSVDSSHVRTVSSFGFQGETETEMRVVDEQAKTQLEEVMEELVLASSSIRTDERMIWRPPLEPLFYSRDHYIPMCWGIIDDYVHGKYEPLVFDRHLCGSVCVLSSFRTDRIALILSVLTVLFQEVSDQDQIFLLNGIRQNCSSFADFSFMTAVLTPEMPHEIQYLFRLLRKRNQYQGGRLVLIVNDYSVFQQDLVFFQREMQYLLEHQEDLGLQIIVFVSSSGSIAYRLLTLFHQKICLRNGSPQEISAFLDSVRRKPFQEEHAGLILREQLLVFRYFQSSETILKQLVKECKRDIRINSFPVLPNVIKAWKTDGKCHVGIGLRSFHWIDCSAVKPMLILASYVDELDDFRSLWDEEDVDYRPGKESLSDPERKVKAMTLLTADDYVTAFGMRGETIFPLLYIGEGCKDQILFRFHEEILPNTGEGIYFHNGRTEVVRVVRE